jgi:hypothetical protein
VAPLAGVGTLGVTWRLGAVSPLAGLGTLGTSPLLLTHAALAGLGTLGGVAVVSVPPTFALTVAALAPRRMFASGRPLCVWDARPPVRWWHAGRLLVLPWAALPPRRRDAAGRPQARA